MPLLLSGSESLGAEHSVAYGKWVAFVEMTLLPTSVTLIFGHKMEPNATF